jgi:hypothetical protein
MGSKCTASGPKVKLEHTTRVTSYASIASEYYQAAGRKIVSQCDLVRKTKRCACPILLSGLTTFQSMLEIGSHLREWVSRRMNTCSVPLCVGALNMLSPVLLSA